MVKHKGWQPLTGQERQAIVDRYTAGETIKALRTEYRRTRQTIKDVLLEADVTLRPPGYGKGREWTPEWREAHRRATSTPEFREKSRQTLLQRLPSMRGPAVNTAIEQRLHNALMKAGIGFTAQSALLEKYLVDIEIRQAPIVIEADGAQHTLSNQKAKDAVRDAELTAAGYRVLRFTGSEINSDAVACIQRVIDGCHLVPDEEPVYEVRTSFSGPMHPLWKGGKREFTCTHCSEPFHAQPKHRTSERTFCSMACYHAHRRATRSR